MTRLLIATVLTTATLSINAAAQSGDVFYRNGQQCQRASSGAIICRNPGDYWSPGRVVGESRGYPSEGVFYRRNGDVCQRASSGAIVCRDPRDRWSNGYAPGQRY